MCSTHTGLLVCRLLKNPLEPERIQEIITEAVDIEKSFICDSLPVSAAFYALLLNQQSACDSVLYVTVTCLMRKVLLVRKGLLGCTPKGPAYQHAKE